MTALLIRFAGNSVFSHIILFLLLVAGLMAVNTMQRELFPDFSMDEILVEVRFPGADPSEVQQGVTVKIEEALKGMEGIAQYTSRSEEGIGSAEILVKHGYETAQVLARIRSRINAVSTFPDTSDNPVISEVMHRTEVMKIYVSGSCTEKELKAAAVRIKERLTALDEISQVELFGTRDYEINVELNQQQLKAYGLSLEEVSRNIALNSDGLPGGDILTDAGHVRVRTMGQRNTGRELAEVPVLAGIDGGKVILGRIADIRDSFTEDTHEVTINGSPAVILEIYKTRREDALEISAAVASFLDRQQDDLPSNLSMGVLYDLTDDLRSRIDLLAKNGLIGLCLVILLLGLFLDIRLSFWAGLGIPVSILGALVVVWAMGGSINMLSLFGLITVLGIVVDDSIVVGEAVFHHFESGCSPLQAAVRGVREVGIPVTAAILTSIIAFLPLAYIGDVIGKFLSILPMVVIPCLIISLIESVWLLPAHLAHRLRKKGNHKPGHPFLEKMSAAHRYIQSRPDWFARCLYLPFLKRVLVHRYLCLSAATVILLLCAGLIWGGWVKTEVLPETGSTILSASITFPAGTSDRMTSQAVSRIENALLNRLRKKPGTHKTLLLNRMTVVGSTVSEEPEKGSHAGGIQVVLTPAKEPGVPADALLKMWKEETGAIPGARSLVFETRSEGPPGEPIEAWLLGQDPVQLTQAFQEFTRELSTLDGVHEIHGDDLSGVDERHITLKPLAWFHGLSQQDVARQVRTAIYGSEALRVQRGKDEICVKVRMTRRERSSVSILDNLELETRQGTKVPLHAVAHVQLAKGPERIRGVDGTRCLAVSADVDLERANPDDIIEALTRNLLPRLARKYPGVTVSFEGDEKHMKDALGGLYIGFPLAVIGIFVVVAAMFHSYVQPLVILFMIPFGMVGAVYGHLVMGYPISLMSIFGMVALSGVVVNDAIMLIERFNSNLESGTAFFEALENAGRRRFRAIMLTTVSTVSGLAPLLFDTSIQAGFIIPMALSISAGLICATAVTLILAPCILAILNDLRLIIHTLPGRMKASRESLEPAVRKMRWTRENISPTIEQTHTGGLM
ncbi:MAG: efflux RND transporter permease subunit [Desulfobacteraceae bacterium]|nr:MAG: efflux RND transporter permease subunit [Desulfobacteraceae bacterium]